MIFEMKEVDEAHTFDKAKELGTNDKAGEPFQRFVWVGKAFST